MIEPRTLDEDWRHWLRGGFAFETAIFAAHPSDAERAQRSFFVSHRAGVTSQEVAAEVRSYLSGKGCNEDFVSDQINRVQAYFASMKISGTAKRAWLVFWNGSEACVTDQTCELVLAFDPRVAEEAVCSFVEKHYQAVEYSSREKLYFSTRKKKNPYRCRANYGANRRVLAYTCGHNPWLEARFCLDVIVVDLADGKQVVSWKSDSRAS